MLIYITLLVQYKQNIWLNQYTHLPGLNRQPRLLLQLIHFLPDLCQLRPYTFQVLQLFQSNLNSLVTGYQCTFWQFVVHINFCYEKLLRCSHVFITVWKNNSFFVLYKVVLTCGSVDEILIVTMDSKERYWVVLFCSTVCYQCCRSWS